METKEKYELKLEYAIERTEYIDENGRVLDDYFNELRTIEGEVIYIEEKDYHYFNMVDKNWEIITKTK